MAKWIIKRRIVGSADPLAPTGEIYDDVSSLRSDAPPLSIDDYLTLREIEDGWEYGAEPA